MKKMITITALMLSFSSFAAFFPNETYCGKVEQLLDETLLVTYSGEKALTAYDYILQSEIESLYSGTRVCVQGRSFHDEILVKRILPFYMQK